MTDLRTLEIKEPKKINKTEEDFIYDGISQVLKEAIINNSEIIVFADDLNTTVFQNVILALTECELFITVKIIDLSEDDEKNSAQKLKTIGVCKEYDFTYLKHKKSKHIKSLPVNFCIFSKTSYLSLRGKHLSLAVNDQSLTNMLRSIVSLSTKASLSSVSR